MKINLNPFCVGLSVLLLILDRVFSLGWSWWTITSPIWVPFLLVVIPVGISMIIFSYFWFFHPEKIKWTFKGEKK